MDIEEEEDKNILRRAAKTVIQTHMKNKTINQDHAKISLFFLKVYILRRTVSLF